MPTLVVVAFATRLPVCERSKSREVLNRPSTGQKEQKSARKAFFHEFLHSHASLHFKGCHPSDFMRRSPPSYMMIRCAKLVHLAQENATTAFSISDSRLPFCVKLRKKSASSCHGSLGVFDLG